MDAQHVSINMSFMMILVLGVIAIAVLVSLTQILGTLTGRQRHSHGEQVGHNRRSQGAMFAAATGVGVLLLAGVFLSYRQAGFVEIQHSDVAQQGVYSETRTPGSSVETTEVKDLTVPTWTKTEEVVLHEGPVGETLFVVSSQPCDSEEQARREAVQLATVKLKERLSEKYPDFNDQPIPAAVFEVHALKQAFTETWMEQFGAFEEPMYRVYIQYEDSARVREPIEEAWQRSAVDGRVTVMAGGMGIAAMGLGMLSAFMRIFLAAPGKRRGPVLTTAAFAGAAGLIATLV
jgi:hypothetical protein